jgi:hypothetical protein
MLSIATTVTMFGVSQKIERNKKTAEKNRDEAAAALNGFLKLKAISDGVYTIEEQLKEAYATAFENGLGDASPFAKVNGFVGADGKYEPLVGKELHFLISSKNALLINDVDLMWRRMLSLSAAVAKYTDLKASFELFGEQHAEEISGGEGTIVSTSFSGRFAHLASIKEGSMNSLLGQIHELIDRDLPESKRVASAYLEAARAYFGNDFPDFKMEWVGK